MRPNLDEIRTMFHAGSRSGKKLMKLCDDYERLEGLLRAWFRARGDDESEASKELWREAVRLAKEKT